ncbi:hypothetical protein [Phocaeicola abscessus]|uniref:hypothetical protein n=1 Tax=Phocaeicola abscessus TaxID=555313 RepID=UPI0004ADCEDF|nr:hypothetical protein [Phocaeicola abscessus]
MKKFFVFVLSVPTGLSVHAQRRRKGFQQLSVRGFFRSLIRIDGIAAMRISI